jgi:hypothetical protein
MARRRRKTSMPRIAIVVAVLALFGVGLWFGVQRMRSTGVIATVPVAADHADAANEGRKVSVTGKLEIARPARDPQLGISADAAILFRDVSMFQWREHCDGNNCRYDTGWLRLPLDSHKFRISAGHENPPFPFADARFVAGEIRLGALTVDPDLIASASAIAYPVRASALPPNLAATFREVDGVLLTGSDAGPPSVGEVHVSYRIVPLGAVSLTGVQRGAKLTAN